MNEATLKDAVEKGQLAVNVAEGRYNKLLAHAEEKIAEANKEIAAVRESNTNKVGAVRSCLVATIALPTPSCPQTLGWGGGRGPESQPPFRLTPPSPRLASCALVCVLPLTTLGAQLARNPPWTRSLTADHAWGGMWFCSWRRLR